MGKSELKKAYSWESVLSPETIPLPRWAQPWTVLLLLSLLAILIYSNTFSAPFHFDDKGHIVDNPRIKNFSSLSDFSESRYVGYISFTLNYHIGQLNVFGYHLVNLLIHIINGFLVYAFVLMLLRIPPVHLTPHSSRLTATSWIALATALLFIAHPIQTQAVTYIVQRFTSLATLFYLLAVVSYLKWRLASEGSERRSLYYAGALLSTVLAMKTKEIAFTLPFMLLLIEAVFFGSSTRKQWIALIPFLLTLVIIPISLPGSIGGGEGFVKETTEISRLDYLFTQFRVIMTYLRLLIFPLHQNLDYDYPISHSLLEPKVLFSFLFLSGLVALALYLLFISQRYTRSSQLKLICFGLLWFFLALSVESSIIPIRDVIFEHRLYLPSVGFLLAGNVVILGLMHRWREMTAIVICVLVVILSVATYQRNLIWKDDLTLWTDVVQKSPTKARGHNNLGIAYQDLGRSDEAIQEYKTALALEPNYAEAHNNLGSIYSKLERPDEAIQEFRTALTLKSDNAEAHYNLGIAYQKLERFDEAIQEFRTALTLKPHDAEAHYNLGNVYKDLGRPEEAIREYEAAVTLNPNYAEAHNNLGNLYSIIQKHPDKAIQEYKIALALKPDDAEAHSNLGTAHKNLGQLDKAIQEYKTALALKPDYAGVHYNLGTVYKDLGRLEEAIREYQIALKLKPDLVQARYSLGQVYQRMGQTPEAIHEFEQALQIKPDYDPARQALKSLPR